MSREIKFRAWEKNLKEIIPVHSIDFEHRIINSLTAWRRFDEVELMQYTGLKDKNGKEIYEGDIVKTRGRYGMTNLVVKFEKGCFLTGYHSGSSTAYTPKLLNPSDVVIGNIYENPELLES